MLKLCIIRTIIIKRVFVHVCGEQIHDEARQEWRRKWRMGSSSGVWVFRHTAYKVFISMIYDARGMSGAITLVSHQRR